MSAAADLAQRAVPSPRLSVGARLAIVVWVMAIVLVVAVLTALGRTSPTSQILGNVAILAALLFSLASCVRAASRPTRARPAWIGLAVAMLLGGVGQAAYVASAVTRSETRPSVASDTFAFLGYAVPFLVAMFLFPRPQERLLSRFRQVLDVLVITVGVVLVSEATVLHPVRMTVDLGTVEGLLLFAYPVADVAICAVVLCLGIRQRPGDRLAWLALGSGMVIVGVTDSVYVRLIIDGQTNLTATPLVAGYMAGPVLIGLAAWIPLRGRGSQVSATSLGVQLVPYLPVLGSMVVLSILTVLNDPFLLVAGVVLLVLVIVRQVMIVWENVVLTHDLEAKVAERTAELTTLGSIVTSSSEAIVGVSLDNRVTAWNPAAERLYGYAADRVIGGAPTFLPRDALRAVGQLLEDARRGQQLSSLEVDWERPDGTVVPVAMTLSPIVDEQGVQGISVIGQDITERRRAAAYLEQAREDALESSRLKSEFLATMSHEIRTPMNGVIGLTSLLLETQLDGLQRQYAEGVRGAGEALLTVINDILDFSKLEAGKIEVDPIDFDPHHLVDEVGALLAPAASAKGLELIAYCVPGVPQSVHGDLQRIRQILLNLASNAVKFTTVGEVAVRVKSQAAEDGSVRLRFEVSDTGIGIAAKDQDRLFESFTQADASTTRRFGGTGLGLAISRRLVEVMDGTIGLESEEGHGSLFWFEVPLPAGSATVAPEEDPALDLLPGLRALVVDDNATNRLVLERQLTSWGLHADVAEDAEVATEMLRDRADTGRPYHLAVLDMHMPDVDGMALARRIQEDPVLEGMPLIMLTSGNAPTAAEMTAAGIGQCVAKPVRSSELYERLVRLMSPREAELRVRTRTALSEPRGDGERGTILVVEDNALNQLVADGIVSRLGYRVRAATDGVEALQALEKDFFHAVLMDCHMPRMDGFEATREIRRREAGGHHIPIIAMTAGALPEDRVRCLEAGMDAYVSKPIDVDALAGLLAELDGEAVPPLRSDDRPTTNGSTHSVLDASRLADLSELASADGTGLLQALVASFVERSENRLQVIRAAATSDDRATLESAAHELKGAAGTIGAVRVAQLCRELETVVRRGEPVSAQLVTDLATELATANEELQGLHHA